MKNKSQTVNSYTEHIMKIAFFYIYVRLELNNNFNVIGFHYLWSDRPLSCIHNGRQGLAIYFISLESFPIDIVSPQKV